jgi:hypothetical protein
MLAPIPMLDVPPSGFGRRTVEPQAGIRLR